MRSCGAIVVAVLCLVASLGGAAHAGGPFVVDSVNNTGQAQSWQNDTMEWYVDDGPLTSSVDNDEARGWAQEMLEKWTSVTIQKGSEYISTAVISTRFMGKVGEDIDGTNYGDYVNARSGPTVVIFDDNGDITAELVGEQNRNTVVGLSAPLLSDSTGLNILKGFAMFNGLMLSEGVLSVDAGRAEDLFKATVLHELGHLLNLDHSQVNFDIAQACDRNRDCTGVGCECDGAQYIPTMYPELLTTMQGNPSRDDKVTLSWIYPGEDFGKEFCEITGEIFDAAGQPLKGVNVLAASAEGTTMPLYDARSFVSGVLKPGCIGGSRYYLRGIVPGRSYAVKYEPIGAQFTGTSDFEPLDNPPQGFDDGVIYDTSGASTVSCGEGGEVIEMASVTIDVENPCTASGNGDDGGQTAASSSGCALIVPSRGVGDE